MLQLPEVKGVSLFCSLTRLRVRYELWHLHKARITNTNPTQILYSFIACSTTQGQSFLLRFFISSSGLFLLSINDFFLFLLNEDLFPHFIHSSKTTYIYIVQQKSSHKNSITEQIKNYGIYILHYTPTSLPSILLNKKLLKIK